jgi:hypothetical protein
VVDGTDRDGEKKRPTSDLSLQWLYLEGLCHGINVQILQNLV